MARTKADIQDMSLAELITELRASKQEALNLRFRNATGQLEDGGFEAQERRAFANLEAVARASGGSLADCVKLTLFLTDLAHFSVVNTVMEQVFPKPFPARFTVGVARLPLCAQFEVEAVMVLPG